MTLHELRPRALPSAMSPQPSLQPLPTVQRLAHWAQAAPLQIALRHRRQGEWFAWRWIDVLREVEQLAAGLRQQGFSARSRLAVSGAYETDLLLLSLAAQASGGTVVGVPRPASSAALVAQLQTLRPTHGFVQDRRDLPHWQGCHEQVAGLRVLITAQPPLVDSGPLPVLGISHLLGERPSPTTLFGLPAGSDATLLWVEEGTDWEAGLEVILGQWLSSGQALAFPESPGSAARDRRAVAPTGLLLSSARLQVLAQEIEARLPPPGSWRRRLCDWTIEQPRRGLRRLLKQRVQRLLGFENLRSIWQAPNHTQAHHPWTLEPGKDVA